MIGEFALKKALETALRYPSAHNVQPALVHVNGDQITLFQDLKRFLTIGDPHGFDNDVSLGAFFECFRAGLLEQGFVTGGVSELFNQEPKNYEGKQIKARFQFTVQSTLDNEVIERGQQESLMYRRRRSFRGKFAKALPQHYSALKEIEKLNSNWIFLTERAEISALANLYDRCSYSFLQKSDYQKELYDWMRLDASDSQYFLDGLNREAMALNEFEAWFAKRLLAPAVFEKLKGMGLGSALVSEAGPIKSSMAIGVLFVDQKLSAFEAGQCFVKAWALLGNYGLYACPLSALSDSPEGREYFAKYGNSHLRLLNVLRIGPIASEKVYRSPRLSLRDILLDGSVSV